MHYEKQEYKVHNIMFFFFFNDPAPTEIYLLPLHDALPISPVLGAPATQVPGVVVQRPAVDRAQMPRSLANDLFKKTSSPIPVVNVWTRADKSEVYSVAWRSEEHTSELQSRLHLVCRLLLEK